MPIDTETLDALARRHVAPMTSIRGRRIHRLLMRAFAGLDAVLPAVCADGAPAIVGLGGDGRIAICRSDGRGPLAEVVVLGPAGAAVTTAHDLLKDSLPIVRWTIDHPALGATGPLAVAADGLSAAEVAGVARLLAAGAAG